MIHKYIQIFFTSLLLLALVFNTMDVCENIFDNENLTECELKCETEKDCKEKKNTEDDKWLEHKNVSFSCIVLHINTGIHSTYLPFEATHFREIFAPPPNG